MTRYVVVPRKHSMLSSALVLLALVALIGLRPTTERRGALPALPAHLPDQALLPLAFEPNTGQTTTPARFIARAPGSTIYFSPAEVAIAVEPVAADRSAGTADAPNMSQPKARFTAFERAVLSAPPFTPDLPPAPPTVRMQFVNANPNPAMTNGELLPGKVNYLIGNDPQQWHSNLPTYAGVVYHGLYPGIDLTYAGTASNLKGTYTLAPGADPTSIRWRYDGASATTVDADGNLH